MRSRSPAASERMRVLPDWLQESTVAECKVPFGCSHKDYRRILTLFIAHGVRNVQRKVHGRPPFSWVLTRGFLKARGTQNRLGFMSSCGYRKTAEGGAPAKSDQNANHPVG